jgi:hypothetical protein
MVLQAQQVLAQQVLLVPRDHAVPLVSMERLDPQAQQDLGVQLVSKDLRELLVAKVQLVLVRVELPVLPDQKAIPAIPVVQQAQLVWQENLAIRAVQQAQQDQTVLRVNRAKLVHQVIWEPQVQQAQQAQVVPTALMV